MKLKKAAVPPILSVEVAGSKFKRQTKHVAAFIGLLKDAASMPPPPPKFSDKQE